MMKDGKQETAEGGRKEGKKERKKERKKEKRSNCPNQQEEPA